MEEVSPPRLILVTIYLKNLLLLTQYLTKMKWLMLSELLKVEVCKVLCKDLELNTYKKNPIEGLEK